MRVPLWGSAVVLAAAVFSAQTPAQTSSTASVGPCKVQPDARQSRPPQPYTAEFKTTSVQTLANGATITHETTSAEARDSQGRTMNSTQQVQFAAGVPSFTFVNINDPVENTQIQWDSQQKKATITKMPPKDQRSGCWADNEGHIRMSFGPRNVQSTITQAAAGAGLVHAATLPAPVPMQTPRMPQPNREDLGTETIQGLEAHGERWTTTMPAGQIGNDKPLVTTTETWISRDFGLIVRTIRDDPQMGKNTRELVSFTPGEPDLAVFQPPQDYEVVTIEMHEVPCNR